MKAKVFILSMLLAILSVNTDVFALENLENAIYFFPVKTAVQDTGKCSELIMKDGQVIKVEIHKITESAIEYVKCGTSAPLYTVSKTKVLSIKYPDGTIEKVSVESVGSTVGKTGAIISFVFSLIGLFILPFLFGLIAIIWGAISLGRMNKAGTKGKGFAIAAIVIGVIDVLWAISHVLG